MSATAKTAAGLGALGDRWLVLLHHRVYCGQVGMQVTLLDHT